MELRQLRYFLAVAEELHFTRAATKLRVAQPALSHQIRQLESEIGVTLFERTNRRVRLTSAGLAFQIRARVVIEQASRAVGDAVRASSGLAGSISIGFVSSAAFGVLPGLLRRFHQSSSSAEVELRELEPSEQLVALREGRLDLGMMHALLDDPDFETMPLSREKLIVALPKGHPEAVHRNVQLRKLAAETFIMPRRHATAGFHEVVMAACQRAGFSPAKIQGTRLLLTAVSLVGGRLGVALVPESFRNVLRIRGVVYRPLSGPAPQAELIAVWRRDNESSLLRGLRAAVRAHSLPVQ
jgi:DNA-binding transcriptional LysR family regulator